MEGEKNKTIFKSWKFWIIVIIGLMGILWITNYNGLSETETVDRFLKLAESSDYEKAKKYTTMKFDYEHSLTYFSKNNLSDNESFTYSYGNYYLEDADIAYVNWKLLSHASIIKFELVNTIFGIKINDFSQESIDF